MLITTLVETKAEGDVTTIIRAVNGRIWRKRHEVYFTSLFQCSPEFSEVNE